MLITPNYALKKPEGTDNVNIQDLNYNADAIDMELKAQADAAAAQKADVTSELSLKTSKIYTDAQDATKRDRAVKLNGTLDFDDETKEQMTGVTPITYNAIPADDSLVRKQFAFPVISGRQSINLFDKDNIIIGKYANMTDGTLWDDASLCVSDDYVPLLPNTTYVRTSSAQIPFYDINKVFISGVSAETFTTPINCYFTKANFYLSELDTAQLQLGSTLMEYESFTPKIAVNQIYDEIPANKLGFPAIVGEESKNLFNMNDLIDNKYYDNSSGGLWDNANFAASRLIEVEPSSTYTIENYIYANIQRYALFNEDGSFSRGFIGTLTSSENVANVTTTSSEHYIGLSVYKGFEQYLQLVKGGSGTGYEVFGPKVLTSQVRGSAVSYKNVITVAKSGGDYTTINDAMAHALDSVDNPVVIYVMPGTYFEMLYLRDRYITIIGMDKYTCVIREDYGEYGSFAVNLGVGSNLVNLTVISTHDNGTPVNEGYAVHFDYWGTGVSRVENCIIKTKQNGAMGIGMQSNQTLILKGTDFIQEEETTGRALFMHNYQLSGAVNQKIIVDNCRITSEFGTALSVIDANHEAGGTYDDAQDTVVTFINNMFYSNELGKIGIVSKTVPLDGISFSGGIKLSPQSYGNNIAELNSQ